MHRLENIEEWKARQQEREKAAAQQRFTQTVSDPKHLWALVSGVADQTRHSLCPFCVYKVNCPNGRTRKFEFCPDYGPSIIGENELLQYLTAPPATPDEPSSFAFAA